jgi:acyl carrier protein
MDSRLKQVFSNVFLVDSNTITDETSPDNLASWDSIGHLNLITSIEEEFDVIFTEDQIIEMLNFKLVCLITNEAIDAKK